MTHIDRIQPVQYDRRTDIISPVGRSYSRPDDVAALTAAGFVIVGPPLVGWGRYTHLLATPSDYGDDAGAPHFIARFAEGEEATDTA